MGYVEDIAHLLSEMDYTLERGQASTKAGIDLIDKANKLNARNRNNSIIDTELYGRRPEGLFTLDNCFYLYNQHNIRVGSITADREYGVGIIIIQLYGQIYASRWVELSELEHEYNKLLSTLCIRIDTKELN